MKLVCTILCIFASWQAFAQVSSHETTRVDSLLSKIQPIKPSEFIKSDTGKHSLHQALEAKRQAEHKYDSVAGVLQKPQDEWSSYNGKIDSIQHRLTSKIDSLTSLPDPNRVLIKSLDSLRGKLDSLRQTGGGKVATQTVDKVKEAQNKVASLEAKVNEKLNLFNNQGGNAGTINLPSVSGTGTMSTLTPNMNLPENPLNGSLNLKDQLPNGELPGVNGLQDAANVPKEKLSEVANIDALKDAQGKLGEVSEVTGQINGYSSDIKNLASGNVENMEQLPQAIESKAASLEDVKDFQEEVAPVTDYTEMIKKWNSDPAVRKEMALNQAKEMAVNHFAGHETELKSAMEQLSKMKAKRKDVYAVVDIFKKQSNPMKGKPFIERLVPGIGLQFQASGNTWVDFNPYSGYRWTGRWTTGFGWTERVSYNFKHWEYIAKERAYGPRGFVEFMVKENLQVRAEAEYIIALVTSPYLLNRAEHKDRAWVWSYMAGVKKSFNFSKTVRGNVQMMYNLYNPLRRSPYTSRLNVRMGFEFGMKKQKQSEKGK